MSSYGKYKSVERKRPEYSDFEEKIFTSVDRRSLVLQEWRCERRSWWTIIVMIRYDVTSS
jgi:hypothetical protein